MGYSSYPFYDLVPEFFHNVSKKDFSTSTTDSFASIAFNRHRKPTAEKTNLTYAEERRYAAELFRHRIWTLRDFVSELDKKN
jgi:hypothetical protein